MRAVMLLDMALRRPDVSPVREGTLAFVTPEFVPKSGSFKLIVRGLFTRFKLEAIEYAGADLRFDEIDFLGDDVLYCRLGCRGALTKSRIAVVGRYVVDEPLPPVVYPAIRRVG